jgi:hypothetical protein
MDGFRQTHGIELASWEQLYIPMQVPTASLGFPPIFTLAPDR